MNRENCVEYLTNKGRRGLDMIHECIEDGEHIYTYEQVLEIREDYERQIDKLMERSEKIQECIASLETMLDDLKGEVTALNNEMLMIEF